MNKSNVYDFLLGCMATSVADDEVATILQTAPVASVLDGIIEWCDALRLANPRFQFKSVMADPASNWRVLHLSQPYTAMIGFRLVTKTEAIATASALPQLVLSEARSRGLDLSIIVLAPGGTPEHLEAVGKIAASADELGKSIMVMEPGWVAAIVVAHLAPLSVPQLSSNSSWQGGGLLGPAMSDSSGHIKIRRVSTRYQPLRGSVLGVAGSLAQHVRKLEADDIPNAIMLTCSTYPPSPSFSAKAVRRYYESTGANAETVRLALQKLQIEHESFVRHIASHRRIDILDRGTFLEYLSAPEYYQLPLTPDELVEHIENLVALLSYENYTLCLTPEAVDICFEIRGPEVRLRTDRRNKAPQRVGRIANIVLHDEAVAESFQREFWLLYEVTEAEFKNKEHLRAWIQSELRKCTQDRVVPTSEPIK